MKFLVIGATGNIGSSLAEQLSGEGRHVCAASRNVQGIHVQGALDKVVFDYDDPTSWITALSGVTRIFMIPKAGDPCPDETLLPFIDAAAAAGTERIVFSTAMGLDKDWRVLCVAEDHLIKSGLEYTILRPGWFMQNFTRGFLSQSVKSGLIAFPAGRGSRLSFIDTRDIAGVAKVALCDDDLLGGEFTLTGPESLSWEETTGLLSAAYGGTVCYEEVTEKQWRDTLLSAGLRPYRVEQMLQMARGMREGLYENVTETVTAILGRPAYGLQAYLAEQIL